MENLLEILNTFTTISLHEMDTVELMNRKDSKYFFSKSKLPEILELLKKNYSILEIEGIKEFSYNNIYFDTEHFDCYHQHHNQRANRYKIRIRKYAESNLIFLEIKFKTNQGRTIKSRIKLTEFSETLTQEAKDFISIKTHYNPDLLKAVLRNDFKRITLVNKNLQERCTLDTHLILQTNGDKKIFTNLCIAELKQDISASGSKFKIVMRDCRVTEGTISKYSVGISYMYAHLKHNNFKPKKIRINRIEHAT